MTTLVESGQQTYILNDRELTKVAKQVVGIQHSINTKVYDMFWRLYGSSMYNN